MTNQQDLSLGVILSIHGGVLVCEFGKMAEAINWLTGDSVFTHQLPRVAEELKPQLEKQLPWLAEIDYSGVGKENWKEWLAEKVTERGERHTVSTCSVESRDPIEELCKMVSPEKIVTVPVPTEQSQN